MPHGGGSPNAAAPVLTKPSAEQASVPLIDSPDPNQRAVYESVNNQGDRVGQIIQQREQAKQMAADLREQREATAQARADRQSDDGGNALKPHEVDSARAPKVHAAQAQVEPRPTQPPAANSEITSWEDPRLSAAEPSEDGDFGDNARAGRFGSVQGSVAAPTEVQRVPLSPVPSTGRPPTGPGIDPLLALQEQYISRVNDQPRNLAAQLELQLTRFLRNEPVPAMADLSALAGEDRELLAAISDALANFRNLVRDDPNALGAEKARPFVEMTDRIRSRTDLSVDSVNLCTLVRAFGNYEPIEPLQFVAGNPTWSVFYCEVDGFLSQLNEKQLWESKLSLELRLYNSAGMQLWRNAPETVSDMTRKRRRDFFIAKKIQLPPKLAPGAYMLKATVRDLQANRVAESTLRVTIVGK